MKLYKISAAVADGSTSSRWAGSQADAASARKAFNSSGIKRDDITTEEINVPTDKVGLLAFLNAGAE